MKERTKSPPNRYLSIITNFGCHYTCPYCIVKENNLHIPRTTIEGLAKLKDAIIEHNCNWVSISGGGDPLHNIADNVKWYQAMLKSLPNQLIKLELHTSYFDVHKVVFENEIFDRIVYHLRNVEDIAKVQRHAQYMRVVFVVTEDFDLTKLIDIHKAVRDNPNIDELSFRQMVDNNYEATHYCEMWLKLGHKLGFWHYIEQNDYNLYYCENEVSTRYEDFKKEV